MKVTSKILVAALLGAVSASAVWAAPCSDKGFDRGYAAYPFAEPQFAPPLSEEQIAAIAERQRAFGEQQARFAQQAMEAQRRYIEQLMPGQPVQPEPFADNRMPFEPRFDQSVQDIRAERDKLRKEMETYRQKRLASRPARPDFSESKARREAMRAQMDERRAEMLKQVEAQRKQAQERHANLRKQAEERRSCNEV